MNRSSHVLLRLLIDIKGRLPRVSGQLSRRRCSITRDPERIQRLIHLILSDIRNLRAHRRAFLRRRRPHAEQRIINLRHLIRLLLLVRARRPSASRGPTRRSIPPRRIPLALHRIDLRRGCLHHRGAIAGHELLPVSLRVLQPAHASGGRACASRDAGLAGAEAEIIEIVELLVARERLIAIRLRAATA